MNEETRELAKQNASSPEEVRQVLHRDLSDFNRRVSSAQQAPPVAPPSAPVFTETSQTIEAKPIRTTSTSSTSAPPPSSPLTNRFIIAQNSVAAYYDVASTHFEAL